MIDPQDYAEIVAKRPELAVPALTYAPKPHDPQAVPFWTRSLCRTISDDEAEALICWHWVKQMEGTGYSLAAPSPYSSSPTSEWHIVNVGVNSHDPEYKFGHHPDPLSALTAFWRQYT